MLNNIGEFAIRSVVVIGIVFAFVAIVVTLLSVWIRHGQKAAKSNTNNQAKDTPFAGSLVHPPPSHGMVTITDKCIRQSHEIMGACWNCCKNCELGTHHCDSCGARLRHDGKGIRGEDHSCVPAATSGA